MRLSTTTWPLLGALTLGVCGLASLSACSSPPVVQAVSFDQAATNAANTLVEQLQGVAGGASDRHAVILDPTLDAESGQQTSATQQLDRIIGNRVMQARQLDWIPFDAGGLARAQFLVVGSLARASGGHRINLALLNIQSGIVVAQSSALARLDAADMKPLNYYRDSPVVVSDDSIEAYIRTSTASTGQKADASYLSRIGAAATINEATKLYNAGRYREALAEYRRLAATPTGYQIRVLNGVYLSNARLGRSSDAEDAFGKLVAYGLAQKSLSVKFLFNPGSTDFWSDSRLTSAYGMWLRQIARQASNSQVCMDIVGHTSRTGPEEVNDNLSSRRASFIKSKLTLESGELGARTRTVGMGSRHNLVGSGTDDVVDAPDRRVDFTIVDCKS